MEINSLANRSSVLYLGFMSFIILFLFLSIYGRPSYMFIGSITIAFFLNKSHTPCRSCAKVPENEAVKTLYRRNKSNIF